MRSCYREKKKPGQKKIEPELMSWMDNIFIVFCSKHFKWKSKMIILKIAYLTLLIVICVSSACSCYFLMSSPLFALQKQSYQLLGVCVWANHF